MLCLPCAAIQGLRSNIGWRFWVDRVSGVPRYFFSYNVGEVVEKALCERCKLAGMPVRMLILISIALFVLTIAISNSVLRPVWTPAAIAQKLDYPAGLKFRTIPSCDLGMHWNF